MMNMFRSVLFSLTGSLISEELHSGYENVDELLSG